jgi:hypothetical protein
VDGSGEDTEQIRCFESPGRYRAATWKRAVADGVESWRTGGPARHGATSGHEKDMIVGGVELRDPGDGTVNLFYVVYRRVARRRLL